MTLGEEYILLKNELEYLVKIEVSRLAQITTKKRLKEGDWNSRYFHAMISQKQNVSVIDRMKLAEGTILDSTERIHEGAAKYF